MASATLKRSLKYIWRKRKSRKKSSSLNIDFIDSSNEFVIEIFGVYFKSKI